MGIGRTIVEGYSRVGRPLSERADNTILTGLVQAELSGNSWLQGDPQAVAPMADTTTGTVAPEIPGGLQMQKVVIVLPGQPVVIPASSNKAKSVP